MSRPGIDHRAVEGGVAVHDAVPRRAEEAARRAGPLRASLSALALSAGASAAGPVPLRLVQGIGGGAGRLWGRLSSRRRLVASNLERINAGPSIRPEQVFAAYGRYWAELLALGSRPERLLRQVRVEGIEHLEAAVRHGPVCLFTGHLGNWDLGAAWAAARLPRFAVVAEALEPPSLFRAFCRLRESSGMVVLPAAGGGRALLRHLRAGGHAGIVADRVLDPASPGDGGVDPGAQSADIAERGPGSQIGRAGVRDFCGGPRRFPEESFHLARLAGAALLPSFARREEGRFVIRVHPPLQEGPDPVGAFARILQEEVREAPEQWCMLFPIHDGRPRHPGTTSEAPAA